MKFAAIDVGSNAVRILFSNVFDVEGEPVFKKISLVRLPVRLGEDVFATKEISGPKQMLLLKAMEAFKHLMDVHRVRGYMGCATSAMREAENGAEIVKKIKEQTGIEIKIIDGETEGEIIYSTHIAELLNPKKKYLYIDVGGGSTELTLFVRNQKQASHSFNIGTVRMLQGQVEKPDWKEMRKWIKKNIKDIPTLYGIGTGGNINSIYKLAGKKNGSPLPFKKLKEIVKYVNNYSIEDRIKKLLLNPDRADVIIPAGEIFTSVMKWADIEKIYVPQKGLVDGMMSLMYERHKDDIRQEKLSSPAPKAAG